MLFYLSRFFVNYSDIVLTYVLLAHCQPKDHFDHGSHRKSESLQENEYLSQPSVQDSGENEGAIMSSKEDWQSGALSVSARFTEREVDASSPAGVSEVCNEREIPTVVAKRYYKDDAKYAANKSKYAVDGSSKNAANKSSKYAYKA
jgi:hypothetical protein